MIFMGKLQCLINMLLFLQTSEGTPEYVYKTRFMGKPQLISVLRAKYLLSQDIRTKVGRMYTTYLVNKKTVKMFRTTAPLSYESTAVTNF